MKKQKSPANNFFESLKDDPKDIIEWCKKEIEQYEELIKLIEGANNKKK